MDNFATTFRNKKILTLASIALILIIAGLVFSITTSRQNGPNTSLTPSPATNDQTGTTQTNPVNTMHTNNQPTLPANNAKQVTTPAQSTSEFAIKDWILSDNDVYTFQYPTDWRLQRTLFIDGQTISIIPANQTPTPYTPTWSISITKTNPSNPITNKENFYLGIGFQKTTTTLSGQPTQAVSGTFPNSNATNPLQQTNIYLAKDNYSYVVTYKYPGNTRNQQYEQLFQKITNTVSIEY